MKLLGKVTLAVGALVVSGQALSHGHHDHGQPLTAVEQKAAEGVFSDSDVKDRELKVMAFGSRLTHCCFLAISTRFSSKRLIKTRVKPLPRLKNTTVKAMLPM